MAWSLETHDLNILLAGPAETVTLLLIRSLFYEVLHQLCSVFYQIRSDGSLIQ